MVTNMYTYPLSTDEFTEEVSKLKSSEAWKVVYDRSNVLLFQKRSNATSMHDP